MTGWLLAVVPLLLAPLVLLLAHAGCSFQVGVTPPPTDPYGDAVKAEPGLVGYWRMEEVSGTTAADSSPTGLTGSYSDGVSLGMSGALDGPSYTADASMGDPFLAADFSSEAFLEVPSDVRLQPAFAFSLEVWARFGDNADTLTLMGSLLPGGAGFALGASGPPEKLVVDGLVRAADGTSLVVSANPIDGSAGDWHHVVLTYDAGAADTGEQLTVYVDGGQAGQVSNQSHSYDPPTGRHFRLGYGDDELTAYVGGLDEAAFYNRALDAASVANHHAQRSA